MTRAVTYLLDTNVVSEMMRPAPHSRVVACVDGAAAAGLGIAAVSAWEILNGIGQLRPSERRRGLHDRFLLFLEDLAQGRVFDWTLADAETCAAIMEDKRRRGEPLDGHLPDAMIAATALNHRLTVMTRNEREFRNTGVSVLNPWVENFPVGPQSDLAGRPTW